MSTGSALPPAVGRWLLTSVVLVVVLLMSNHALSTGRLPTLIGVAMLPFMLLFFNNINWWFIAIIGLFNSWIYVPGLPPFLMAFHILAAGIVPVLLAARCMKRPAYPHLLTELFFPLLYAAIILVTILVRGFGVRLLGGSAWGGARYVHLLCGLAFYTVSDNVTLTPKQWRWTVIAFFGSALLPSIAELVFLLSKGQIHHLYYVIRVERVSAVQSLRVILGGQGIMRLQVSKYIAFLFVMFVALYRYDGRKRILIQGTCALAFLFAGLSGHRSAILYLVCFIPLVTYYLTGKVPWRIFIIYSVGLVVTVVLLNFVVSILPLAAQRSISWIPFVDVSFDASSSAASTTRWRFAVWRRLLSRLPDYWLIGRGFVFSPQVAQTEVRTFWHSIDWAVATHNYHSGPLSLLIDVGIPGFLAGCGIMIGAITRHLKQLRNVWADAKLARYHHVILASLTVNVLRFFLVHGDASNSIVQFLVVLTILEGLVRTNRKLLDDAAQPPSEIKAHP